MAIDDNTIYGLYGSQIKDLPEKINAVKGKAKVLTSADYNYPTNNPSKVAAWLLEPGVYTAAPGVIIAGDTTAMNSLAYGVTLIIGTTDPNNKKSIIMIPYTASDGMFPGGARTEMVDATTGVFSSADNWLAVKNTKDSLTSNSTWEPLSAKQGKVLKDLVDSLAVRGAGAPTASTVGQVGTLYEDTTNGDLYICTDATNPYVWEEVGAGGSGGGMREVTSADFNWPTANPDGVATWLLSDGVYYSKATKLYFNTSTSVTGNRSFIKSTTGNGSSLTASFYGNSAGNNVNVYLTNTNGSEAFSNTIVSLADIYADPSAKEKIQIGAGANTVGASGVCIGKMANNSFAAYGVSVAERASVTGSYGVAIGYNSLVNDNFGVAIGSYSRATQRGQFDISSSGSGGTTYGYNGSQYRLLTGLYDPQSAHDAATKGYVDTAVAGAGASAFTTNEWNALWA